MDSTCRKSNKRRFGSEAEEKNWRRGGDPRRGRQGRRSDLEASIGGGDVERGEAVVERGAAGEGGVGGEERGEGVEVPELRRAEVVVLVAGAGAADAVPHGRRIVRQALVKRRLLRPDSTRRRRSGEGGGWCRAPKQRGMGKE